MLLFGVFDSQLKAQGTTLCMLLPPISLFAVYTYYKKNYVDFRMAFVLVTCYIIGTLIGSKIAVNTNEKYLRYGFGTLLLILTCYVFFSAYQLDIKNKYIE